MRTDEPVTEGYVSLLEPFIDTIVICAITALVIGTSHVAYPGFAGDATGVAMTSLAFEQKFSWFPIPLALAAVLFAFSTMIAWSYYGLKGGPICLARRNGHRPSTRSFSAPLSRLAARSSLGRCLIFRMRLCS